MAQGAIFEVRGVKPSAEHTIRALSSSGFIVLPEVVRCPDCGERYLLMLDFAALETSGKARLDLDGAIRTLLDKVSSEHRTGHSSDDVLAICQRQLGRKSKAS